MQAKVRTVAFQGIDVLPVDVQVMIAPGTIAFAVVGYFLADWIWRHRMGRKWHARKLRIGKSPESSALEEIARV